MNFGEFCIALCACGLAACEPRDCKTKIPEGATYRVYVQEAAPTSQGCGVLTLPVGSSFDLVVDDTTTHGGQDECTSRHMSSPPPITAAAFERCTPFSLYRFGVTCDYVLNGEECRGSASFYLRDISGSQLLSFQPHGAVFVVDYDLSVGCPTADMRSNVCTDEYSVTVERTK
jgi:hypothetical protein